ncbi:MAG: 4-(cytidine 5'-diphospho)-2-C-methyl-D-erythritol kinase [Lachnospiraceae bacterium]|nr:4-(cytidine 5'-diphospho)-2-C-methyl-D-erythritol kinase [Lachnospiraceae bacterium]
MDEIKVQARAKINIGLDVTGRRDDGYHLVRMIMQSVDLSDDVIIRTEGAYGNVPEKTVENDLRKDIRITCDRPYIPCDESNLAYKAAALFMDETGYEGRVCIDIVKRIPMAAGLAGGSSDAAAVLTGLNELSANMLSTEDLRRIGLRIGADVPYCIMGKTMLSEGIGEILTELKPFPKCHILLAKPDMDISTAYVYREFDKKTDIKHPDTGKIIEGIAKGDLKQICDHMGNVLEEVTEKEHGIITDIKSCMRKNGALNSMMSGSGPTVFGIFDDKEKAEGAYKAVTEMIPAAQVFITEPYQS